MASIRKRTVGGRRCYQVRWRDGGARDGREQAETFTSQDAARTFRVAVEAAGERWPDGYVPRRGWIDAPAAGHAAMTFADWAEQWVQARSGILERTRADYRRDIRNHLTPAFGDRDVTDPAAIQPADVARWVNAVAAQRSAKTVHNLHALLYMIMQGLTETIPPVLTANPCQRTRLPRLDDELGEEMCFLTHGEYGQLESKVGERYRPLTRLLVSTGLRWSEATALQVRDVDLLATPPTIRVQRAWHRDQDGKQVLGPPKTPQSRRPVPVSPALRELLIPLVAGRKDQEFLFTTRQGQPVRHSNFYNRVWRPAIAAASRCADHAKAQTPCGCAGTLGKRPRIHDLRHTHVSWLIAARIPLPKIQRLLGHKSITTTVDRYGHLMPTLDDDVVAAVDQALGGLPAQQELLDDQAQNPVHVR